MGATDPSPSCSVPHGVLCRMASPVESHWPEIAANHVLPAACLMMSGLALSLTVVGPERWTVGVQHHVAAARRLTGPFLCPCDAPSIQGCDSLVVPIPEHRRTPEGVGHGAVPHMLVRSLVHLPLHRKTPSEIDIPGCPALTAER